MTQPQEDARQIVHRTVIAHSIDILQAGSRPCSSTRGRGKRAAGPAESSVATRAQARRELFHKLPEIEELIQRATTIRQLLITCAGCECDSLSDCRILDQSIEQLPDSHPERTPTKLR